MSSPAAKKPSSPRRTAADTTSAVDAFMATLEHPAKAEIESLRQIVLGVDESVAEGIKWNAPSFRTTEYFATTNLRTKVGVGLILHLGAKARSLPPGGVVVDDPTGLLRWLSLDRAAVEFVDGADLEQKRRALADVLRQWLAYV